MIINYKNTVSYMCPFCSKVTAAKLTPFNFSGRDSITLCCSTRGCREECVKLTQKTKKYIIEVECPACGDNHRFEMSYRNFWKKELVSFKCPVSDTDILACGTGTGVVEVMKNAQDTYEDVFPELSGDVPAPDLIFEIVECLNMLHAQNRISCRCSSSDVSIEFSGVDIKLTCKKCRRSRIIETSEENLAMLLNAEAILI